MILDDGYCNIDMDKLNKYYSDLNRTLEETDNTVVGYASIMKEKDLSKITDITSSERLDNAVVALEYFNLLRDWPEYCYGHEDDNMFKGFVDLLLQGLDDKRYNQLALEYATAICSDKSLLARFYLDLASNRDFIRKTIMNSQELKNFSDLGKSIKLARNIVHTFSKASKKSGKPYFKDLTKKARGLTGIDKQAVIGRFIIENTDLEESINKKESDSFAMSFRQKYNLR